MDESKEQEQTVMTDKTEKQSPLSHFGDKLQQWKPGQSGNPKGRPPKIKYISEAMNEELGGNPLDARAVARAQINKAKKGHTQAFKEVRETQEGRLPYDVEHSVDTTALEELLSRLRGKKEGSQDATK